MGGNAAPRLVEEGAKGIVWAATLDAGDPVEVFLGMENLFPGKKISIKSPGSGINFKKIGLCIFTFQIVFHQLQIWRRFSKLILDLGGGNATGIPPIGLVKDRLLQHSIRWSFNNPKAK